MNVCLKSETAERSFISYAAGAGSQVGCKIMQPYAPWTMAPVPYCIGSEAWKSELRIN